MLKKFFLILNQSLPQIYTQHIDYLITTSNRICFEFFPYSNPIYTCHQLLHPHIYIYTHTDIHRHTHTHILRIYVSIYIHIYIHICTFICVYMYIYLHTHTQKEMGERVINRAKYKQTTCKFCNSVAKFLTVKQYLN